MIFAGLKVESCLLIIFIDRPICLYFSRLTNDQAIRLLMTSVKATLGISIKWEKDSVGFIPKVYRMWPHNINCKHQTNATWSSLVLHWFLTNLIDSGMYETETLASSLTWFFFLIISNHTPFAPIFLLGSNYFITKLVVSYIKKKHLKLSKIVFLSLSDCTIVRIFCQFFHNRFTHQGYRAADQFYATQIPLQATIKDFWQLVYESSAKVIVQFGDSSENVSVWNEARVYFWYFAN